MENVEMILAELLSEYNTLKTERREYKLILDDIISTTNAQYVTDATAGFFPDKTQPAYLCVRAAVFLARAAQSRGAEMVAALEGALADLQKAQWDGVEMNTGKLKPNFLQLRHDAHARSEDEYNHKLAELYNFAGDMFEAAQGRGVPEVENAFAAIAQIATVVSVPKQPPFAFEPAEQDAAIQKAEAMIKYALKAAAKR